MKSWTIEERIEAWKNDSTIKDGHWLFNGCKDDHGYGLITWKRKRIRIHRISAHLFLGLDLNGSLRALHKQTCPYHNCWNPECLYIGTQSDNIRDMDDLQLRGYRYWNRSD